MATDRESLVEKLVVSLHLNVPERQRLGSASVSVGEVAAVMTRILDQTGSFPPRVKAWRPGGRVFEGAFLVKLPNGNLRLYVQRVNPINPNEVTGQRSKDYDDVQDAISMLIRTAWPKGIDGIKIVQ